MSRHYVKNIYPHLTHMSGRELKLLIKGSGFTVEEVAGKIGVSRQTLQTYFNHAEVDGEVVEDVKTKLKLAPEAPAGKKSSSASNAILLEENDYITMMVPLVNKFAYAGYQAGFGDDEYVESLPRVPMMVSKEHKGVYRAFEIRGDSMNNGLIGGYREGYIAYGREIARHHWRDKLHFKSWPSFIIVTKRDGILIKEITKHDVQKGIITLHSWNEEYPDIEMGLDSIAQIFNTVDVSFNKK